MSDYKLVLEHHGILGQKWGVRRFRNADGTRTAAGRKRYKDGVPASRLRKSNRLQKQVDKSLARYEKRFDKRVAKLEKKIGETDDKVNSDKKRRLKRQVSDEVSRWETVLQGHEAMSEAISIYGSTSIKDAKTSDEYKKAKTTIRQYNMDRRVASMVYTPRPADQLALEYAGARKRVEAMTRNGKKAVHNSSIMDMEIRRANQMQVDNMENFMNTINLNQQIATTTMASFGF